MAKRVWFIVLVATLAVLTASPAFCENGVRVRILPFSVNAMEDLGYLRLEIPDQISKRLAREGVRADIAGQQFMDGRDPGAMSNEELRRLGMAEGLDYLVWGSFSKIGGHFSLDARVLPVSVSAPPESYYREGAGMKSLTTEVASLSEDILARILGKKRVAEIVIEGNRRIEKDAILNRISITEGDLFSPSAVSEDIRGVFAMGYFDDVRVESEEAPEGRRLVFHVVEKPTVASVNIKGNEEVDDDEILEVVDITRGSILNQLRIEENVQRIQGLYKDENYYNVSVGYEVSAREDESLADLDFVIEEGQKVQIKEIAFKGNEAFEDKKLRKIMKTSEKGLFSWFTESGSLNREDLDQDVNRISAFYHNHGYIDVTVGEPAIDIRDEWIYITIRVQEGPQYKVGKVDVAGDLIRPRDQLLEKLKISGEETFNREVVRSDVLYLTDLYSDLGYAYAEVRPEVTKDQGNLVVNPTYTIKKGPLVYFERIIITGNTKTRDKVIRRQLHTFEQGLYSGSGLKRGVRNLHRLDYFEDIQVDTVEGSARDKMVLKLHVTEKPTGAFTFGGGYSSVDNAFAVASVSQRNLFGRGQSLSLKAQVGSSTSRFSLSFTEPYLFDTNLSFGVDAYNWARDYDSYEKNSTGGRIRFGYPLTAIMDYTRLQVSYLYEIADIRNVKYYAADAIRVLEGDNTTSKASVSVVYDSRNRQFNPSKGSLYRYTTEYAGKPLGGDVAFTKVTGEAGRYFPLFWNTVFHLRAEGGYVTENEGGTLPIYERFYLGGIGSLRGFDWHDLSPKDEDGAEIGGDKFLLANLEFIFPIVEQAGLVGVVFFDTGASYDDDDAVDIGEFRESAGCGFRWFSPVGPIRVEYGWVLDKKDHERNDGKWEFTMGQSF
ncbi:MAG: outer membrane protein assembly factor BamA [Desulfatibacillaceae bacterium]